MNFLEVQGAVKRGKKASCLLQAPSPTGFDSHLTYFLAGGTRPFLRGSVLPISAFLSPPIPCWSTYTRLSTEPERNDWLPEGPSSPAPAGPFPFPFVPPHVLFISSLHLVPRDPHATRRAAFISLLLTGPRAGSTEMPSPHSGREGDLSTE